MNFRQLVFLGLCVCTSPSWAQQAVQNGAEVSQSGDEYLRSIGRIDTNVSYIDPNAPPPPFRTDQAVDPAADYPDTNVTGNAASTRFNVFTLVAAALLIAVVAMFIVYGGGLQVSLRRQTDNASRAKTPRAAVPGSLAAARPSGLKSILAITDRREALVRLAQSALVRTVAANGILLQDSWTARDALRRIPRDQSLLTDLRALVYDSEGVLFGDRDVTEDRFQDHVARISPLLAEATT